MSVKTEDEKLATANESAAEIEETGNQQPTILTHLVLQFDTIVKKRRNVTLREIARKNGLKLRLLDAWRNDIPKTSDFDKKMNS